MKKHLFLPVLLTLCLNGYSQITFSPGYFIDNTGQKTECLIKNKDWAYNPVKFQYKLNDNAKAEVISIDNVKEFGILNESKYIRDSVEIDISSENLNEMTTTRAADFRKERLFLKVLIEGTANLYFYENTKMIRFFYKVKALKIEQLIYKHYRIEASIGENNQFKQQLLSNLQCESISRRDIDNLHYRQSELMRLFLKYNEYRQPGTTKTEKKASRDLFNFTLRPGITFHSLSLTNQLLNSNGTYTYFKNQAGFRIGLESEFVFPINKNKWSGLIEPTFRYFKSENKPGYPVAKIEYKSIEILLGIRHYFFFNSYSRLFANINYGRVLNLNSKIMLKDSEDLDISTRSYVTFGLGYKYQNKYSLELRYTLNRQILTDYVYWSSQYNSLSVIFGYTIF